MFSNFREIKEITSSMKQMNRKFTITKTPVTRNKKIRNPPLFVILLSSLTAVQKY